MKFTNKKQIWMVAGLAVVATVIFLGYQLIRKNIIQNNLINMSVDENVQNLVTTGNQPSAQGVGLEDAKAMVQVWIVESRAVDRDITGSIENDLPQGLPVRIKGAIFRYEPAQHRLLVSGLVGYKIKSLVLFPDEWQFLMRVGQREHNTMMYGEAQFELLRQPLFDLEPDVLLLTKPYTERLTDGRKLGVQIRWLLLDADYWFVNRYNEIMGKTEEELVKEAPGINEWMLKNRPRPW